MATNMGLFTGMRAEMDSQGAPLNEALVAALDAAMVRALIGVYSIVSAEIRFTVE